jgi:hypothetical protein
MPVRRSRCLTGGIALLLSASHAAAQVLPPLTTAGSSAAYGDLAPMAGPASQVLLSNTAGLDFGSFVAGSGGVVTVSASGARSRSGGVILVNTSVSGAAGVFVTKSSNGGANKAMIMSLPANGQVFLTNGANSMAVNNFTSTTGLTFVLTNAGVTVNIGATLAVGANQPPGQYTGSFPVTVNYQ